MVPTPVWGVNLTLGVSRVFVNWNASPEALSYRVYRGTVDGGPYALVGNNITTLNFPNTGLAAGEYFYVVRAVNGDGESADSSQVSITVPAGSGPGAGGDVSINNASFTELMAVQGIGFDMAQNIINHRPYNDVSELAGVCGMSTSRYAEILKGVSL